jgi:hypothetical protein
MKFIIGAFTVSLLAAGCAQTKFVVMPSFTDIPHIERLKPGMSKSEVSSVLEVSPIDFYYLQDGVDVFVYDYRIAEKRIPTTKRLSGTPDSQNNHVDGLAARNAGILEYTEWRKLYVSYKGDKLAAMITDAGKIDANSVVIQLASLQNLSSDAKLKLVPHTVVEENFVVPLDEKNEFIIGNNSTVTAPTNGVHSIIVGPSEVVTIPPSKPTETKNISRKTLKRK